MGSVKDEQNPCCRPRGTLIITVEPCTKGRKVKESISSNTHILPHPSDLPTKNARTMEIEVKIKSKDEPLFSDENIALDEQELPDRKSISKEKEIFLHLPDSASVIESSEEDEDDTVDDEEEETVIKTRDSIKEPNRITGLEKTSIPSIDYSSSHKTIPIRSLPCLDSCIETCPGHLICFKKEHYMGDNCKLHDPTAIGNQILAMHKHGLFRKPLHQPIKRIYPSHVLYAITEIEQLKLQSPEEKGIKQSIVTIKRAESKESMKESKHEVKVLKHEVKEPYHEVKENRQEVKEQNLEERNENMEDHEPDVKRNETEGSLGNIFPPETEDRSFETSPFSSPKQSVKRNEEQPIKKNSTSDPKQPLHRNRSGCFC